MKPLLAVALGDPCGVGPETAERALRDGRVRRACRAVVLGEGGAFSGPRLGSGPCRRWTPGRPGPESGAASFRAFRLGVLLALEGRVDGLVTAPVSKEAWSQAGLPYKGHNDYFRVELEAEPVMLFCSGRLRAVLATDHVPLARVPAEASGRAVLRAARLARAGLQRLGLGARLGLCALNPHAGEGGLLGREEGRVLAPALRRLRAEGFDIEGPLAADAAWQRHGEGDFDALVALYHDQGLGPLRLAAPRGLVQWSLGLPFIRTSPGHGTAFGLAGKGRADAEPLIQAILLAARLASR